MSGTTTWTTPIDYADGAGNAPTAAQFNQQIRDNVTYLKAVVSGSALQSVVFSDSYALRYGTCAVLRGLGTAQRHTNRQTAYGGASTSLTFTRPFSARPNVIGNIIDTTGVDGDVVSLDSDASTTGLTFSCFRNSELNRDHWVEFFTEGAS